MPDTVIEGVYTISFTGFNREARGMRSRAVAGLGRMTLTKTSESGGTANGFHRATNMPMTGQRDPKDRNANQRHTTYNFSGTYRVHDTGKTGNPIYFEVALDFVEERGDGKLQDKFIVMQCGRDRFWVLSTQPSDGSEPVDEMVFGEAAKINHDW